MTGTGSAAHGYKQAESVLKIRRWFSFIDWYWLVGPSLLRDFTAYELCNYGQLHHDTPWLRAGCSSVFYQLEEYAEIRWVYERSGWRQLAKVLLPSGSRYWWAEDLAVWFLCHRGTLEAQVKRAWGYAKINSDAISNFIQFRHANESVGAKFPLLITKMFNPLTAWRSVFMSIFIGFPVAIGFCWREDGEKSFWVSESTMSKNRA